MEHEEVRPLTNRRKLKPKPNSLIRSKPCVWTQTPQSSLPQTNNTSHAHSISFPPNQEERYHLGVYPCKSLDSGDITPLPRHPAPLAVWLNTTFPSSEQRAPPARQAALTAWAPVKRPEYSVKSRLQGQGRPDRVENVTVTQPYNNLSESRAQTFICAEGRKGLVVLYMTQQDWFSEYRATCKSPNHLPGTVSISQPPPQDISQSVHDQNTLNPNASHCTTPKSPVRH